MKTTKKGSKCGRFFRKFDFIGPEFKFLLPDGEETFRTATGGAFCIFFSILILIYIVGTGIALRLREGYSLVELTDEGVYTDSAFSFGYDNGFAVAAAVWYGDERLNTGVEDPEIGELKFIMKHWSNITMGP